MAAFRYRVIAASGLIGGFRDKEDAEAFAKLKSKEDSFIAVFDKPHNQSLTQISGYLRGERHDLFPPVTT